MTFLYKILDYLPAVPPNIIATIDLDYQPRPEESFANIQRQVKNWNRHDTTAGINQRITHAEFDVWAKENISQHFKYSGVNYVVVDTQRAPITTGAHTDATRDYALFYTLQSGGDTAELYFWQEKNQELARPRKTYVDDLTQLTRLDSLRLPLHQWVLIRTDVLHSVENLYHNRVQLQLSFETREKVESIL
jgi:hypothetical protein